MRKLFLKVYLPVAICIVMTLILSVVAVVKIIPAQLDSYRNSVERFRNHLMDSPHLERDSITAIAETLDLEVIITPNTGRPPRTHPPEGFFAIPGLPVEYPWRVNVSGGPRQGPAGFLRQSFWLILLVLLVMEGLVLFLALWPIRKRLAKLKWAASELGSGNLGIRLQTKSRGDLIDSLGGTFNSMGERIKTLVESHQELLGIVAHELRTPMARMRLALELIREDSGEENLSKIDRMEKDLIALDRLVTELLDFNKLRRESSIKFEQIDLKGVCNEMIQAESWARDGIDLQLRGSGSFAGDISLLGRAVGNLIRNAVNYAQSKVIVSITEDPSGSVMISVADDGDGFEPGIIDRLGKPFTKGHASRGTGLGLAIAERIVALHRGKLSFTLSDELGGAEAVIELSADRTD